MAGWPVRVHARSRGRPTSGDQASSRESPRYFSGVTKKPSYAEYHARALGRGEQTLSLGLRFDSTYEESASASASRASISLFTAASPCSSGGELMPICVTPSDCSFLAASTHADGPPGPAAMRPLKPKLETSRPA